MINISYSLIKFMSWFIFWELSNCPVSRFKWVILYKSSYCNCIIESSRFRLERTQSHLNNFDFLLLNFFFFTMIIYYLIILIHHFLLKKHYCLGENKKERNALWKKKRKKNKKKESITVLGKAVFFSWQKLKVNTTDRYCWRKKKQTKKNSPSYV